MRRSRRRFWKSEDDADKHAAYETLYLPGHAEPFAGAVHPLPRRGDVPEPVRSHDDSAPESVHLCDWPEADLSLVDPRLDEETRLVMRLVSLGRAARSKAGIKVRQPLACAYVKVRARLEEEAARRLEGQILDELNVKELVFGRNEGEFVEFQARSNAALLGPKYGGALREIEEALRGLDAASVAQAVGEGTLVEAGGFTLEPAELLVNAVDKEGYRTAMESGYAVTVPTEIGAELLDEGLAREIVHRLQTMRRNAGFDIADRIVTYYQDDPDIRRVITGFGDYIRQETLSIDLLAEEPPAGAHREEQTIDGHRVWLAVKRV